MPGSSAFLPSVAHTAVALNSVNHPGPRVGHHHRGLLALILASLLGLVSGLPTQRSAPPTRAVGATGAPTPAGRLALGPPVVSRQAAARAAACDLVEIATVADVPLLQLAGQSPVYYAGHMTIDADGAPTAYHPPPDTDLGLDDLANAGGSGNWWGIVTDTGQPDGDPVVQGADDPAPGYYVSTTALQDSSLPPTDPRRYVDATQVPYLVLPFVAAIRELGISLGDFGMVVNRASGQRAGAIFADVGPTDNLGEGSIALADALGVPSDPSVGGASGGIVWVVFPGSGNGAPRDVATIASEAEALFAAFGGMPQIDACFP